MPGGESSDDSNNDFKGAISNPEPPSIKTYTARMALQAEQLILVRQVSGPVRNITEANHSFLLAIDFLCLEH